MSDITTFFGSLTVLQAGVLCSLIAGAGAGVGALPIYVVRTVSANIRDTLLGCAAGLMLAATVFSLVIPGLDAAIEQTGSEPMGALFIGAGMFAGALMLWVFDRLIPHEHLIKDKPAEDQNRIRGVWLFVVAITIHNFPEGLAVGVGFGGGDVVNGLTLTTAIFLQNLPEGFAVALAMMTVNYTPLGAIGVALATGVVEMVGGLVGAIVVSLSVVLLPAALAVAAGAMLFVISHEVIPETHRNGNETPATFGVVAGFALMMYLGVAIS